MSDESEFHAVRSHYERDNLTETILDALRESGLPMYGLASDDLAPIDQFHIGGKAATLELMKLAGIANRMKILDAGGGIGGPARTIASNSNSNVTVLDLSSSFCDTGEVLTMLVGLADRVRFVNGNALAMPFEVGEFDLVWTQHSSMNIDDKESLYREFFRVLKPGGKLAIHEVVAGAQSPIHFPVPWSKEPGTSFLRTGDELRTVINAAGFKELTYVNVSQDAIAFWRKRLSDAATPTTTPLLGLHVLLGPAFVDMGKNASRNLEEDRIQVIQAIFTKP